MPDQEPEPLDALDLAVDRGAEIPIGVQLAWAIRSRIGEGRLAARERLPALRELAAAIDVNVNTVRAVYARLETEGLIESQHGSGTFVASNPPRNLAARQIATDAVREALAAGADPREVAAAVYAAATVPGEGDAESSRRRQVRVQIAALERTAAEIEAEHPGIAAMVSESQQAQGPSLLTAAQLEEVRRGLVRRLSALQRAIDGTTVEPADDPSGAIERAPSASSRARRTRARPATA